MINNSDVRRPIVNGLQDYTGCKVIMANQAVTVPEHPYISFTVTSPVITNNGTYGRYEDNIDRKPIKHIWSFSTQTGNADDALDLAYKAHDFFDRTGIEYLKANGIVVERIGNVTNRDTLLGILYKYRCGFDVTFTMMNEIDRELLNEGEINTANIENKEGVIINYGYGC